MEKNFITLYSKTNCPQCRMLKKLLDNKNIEVNKIINLDNDPDMAFKLKERGIMSLPFLEGVYNNEEIEIRGFRPELVKKMA